MKSEKDYWALFAAVGLSNGDDPPNCAGDASNMILLMKEQYPDDGVESAQNALRIADYELAIAERDVEIKCLQIALRGYGDYQSMATAPAELQGAIDRALASRSVLYDE